MFNVSYILKFSYLTIFQSTILKIRYVYYYLDFLSQNIVHYK